MRKTEERLNIWNIRNGRVIRRILCLVEFFKRFEDSSDFEECKGRQKYLELLYNCYTAETDGKLVVKDRMTGSIEES
ncbi:predicted protein [Sclerotinia sclerotiorum 1980 UF-70]|uniref:Uncharacterized protein n=1 Tax=Sclerotinia sclerotiorum (strain ATCC 18683 / 1980 / Ss-1) TaxID=665079 RepID=A7E681_SCLS1|nr:predicted protein [Sclerotinia sclerotiorum 1980 UF-70]EDN91403.1 predicted protein [Sclerotinia sclerotiorum 1980 UF-70]